MRTPGPFRNRPLAKNRPARVSRPCLENLGERVMPTVQATLSPAGILSLVGDASPADVSVVQNAQKQVVVSDRGVVVATFAPGRTSRITFNGGTGNDVFRNNTALPCTARGGFGNDLLYGGTGSDVLYGDAGDDLLYAGDGDDTLVDGLGQNTLDGGAGKNAVAGLDSRPLTADRLKATGDLMAELTDAGNGKQVVTLSGPGGYGLQIAGTWTVDTRTAGERTFTSSGNTSLKTPLGDLPVGGNLTVTIATGTADDAGKVLRMQLGKVDWSGTANGSALANFRDQTGINLTLPSVGGWKVALGKDLKRDAPGPWNDSVPYLYVTTASLPSLAIGDQHSGTAVSPGQVPQVTLVCDPSDFFVYVKADNLPFGKVNSLELGYSTHGLIPFNPSIRPDDVTDFYGHLYFKGDLDLTGKLPTSATAKSGGGSKLLDLVGTFDVNLDAGAGLGRRKVSDVLSDPNALKGLAVAANVDTGVKLRLGAGSLLPNADVSLALGGGTVVYDPVAEALHLRVASINPLRSLSWIKQTPLASLADAQASVDLTLGKDDFRMAVRNTQLLTVGVENGWSLVATKKGIEASVMAAINLGFAKPEVRLAGVVYFDGKFTLEGRLQNTSVFGTTADWTVTWSSNGLQLVNGATGAGQQIVHTFQDGFHTAEDRWQDGMRTVHNGWDRAGGAVKETWNRAGVHVVETFRNGVIQAHDAFLKGNQAVHAVYTNGLLTFQKTWGRDGSTMLETRDAAGNYTQQVYDSAGRIARELISLKGVTQLRRTWDYLTGRHILEVYENGKLTAEHLYDVVTGAYVKELDLVRVAWDQFVGLF